jgi:hypothetical protein
LQPIWIWTLNSAHLAEAAYGSAMCAFTKSSGNILFLMLINVRLPQCVKNILIVLASRLVTYPGRYAMAPKEQRTSSKPMSPDANPAELAEMGKKQVEAMMAVHKEFIDAIEEVNGEWAARLKAEAELATEFAGKLSAAKSIPETATICQEWMGRRMEMFAEDSRRFAAGIQKFTTAMTRVPPTGWTGGRS